MTTLDDLFPPADLKAEVEAGYVSRKQHPYLPLSLYSYSRSCQYESRWNHVTTRCRGLVVDDTDGRIVGLPFEKFYNVGEHEAGRPYAATLPSEPFEVYDKMDGSLAILFHYAGKWRSASKGSFVSEQACWTQQYLDARNLGSLDPNLTYLAETIYPENCVEGSTSLNLWGGGTVSIREVVTKQLTPTLIGMDDEGDIVPSRVVDHFNNGRRTDWVALRLTSRISLGTSTTKYPTVLRVTCDHKLWLNGQLGRAQDAKPGDRVYTTILAPCESVLHMVESAMLGDGCVVPGKTPGEAWFSEGHTEKRRGYAEAIND